MLLPEDTPQWKRWVTALVITIVLGGGAIALGFWLPGSDEWAERLARWSNWIYVAATVCALVGWMATKARRGGGE